MRLEQFNTIVGLVTLLLIGTASIAALIQLRHLRAANTLNGLLEILRDWQDPQFQVNLRFCLNDLPRLLESDRSFREALNEAYPDRSVHLELAVCDWYEQIGSFLKYGLLNDLAYLDVNCFSVVSAWELCSPVVEIMRETRGKTLYENFEYAAVRGLRFSVRHRGGLYPRNFPRMSDFDSFHPHPTAGNSGARPEASS